MCADGALGVGKRPAMPTETNAESSAPLLNCSHRCGSNITATLFPICSHSGQIGMLRFAVSIEYRRWDLNPHLLARTGLMMSQTQWKVGMATRLIRD